MLHGAGIFTYKTGSYKWGNWWDSDSSTMVRIWDGYIMYTYRSWWRFFLNCEVADKQKNIDLTGLDHATRDAAMVMVPSGND